MKKNSISKQTIFILVLSVVLFIGILILAFVILIPKGKHYRISKTAVYKQNLELKQLKTFQKEVEEKLQKTTSKNRHALEAFSNKFDEKGFVKQFKTYFTSLNLTKKKETDPKEGFKVYDVNTVSSIDSPKKFYDFLEAINKSDWIIKINFPIIFKKGTKVIESSFTMRVYYTK